MASLTKTGALPSGVSFVNNGDGTAKIAGTPAVGSAGNYSITITAANGVMPNADANLHLNGHWQHPPHSHADTHTYHPSADTHTYPESHSRLNCSTFRPGC